MRYTRVKICGITRLDDAMAACDAGVDAIGLVFCEKSVRNIDISQAAKISRALPAFVTSVALFMNEDAATIRHVLDEVPVDCLQFHGDEDVEFCRQFNRPYIKALATKGVLDLKQRAALYSDCRGVLLDSHAPGEVGGTGVAVDWDAIPKDLPHPLILAGGLRAENVAAAIKQVQPYAVDVSSGVEREKGLKDAELMSAFIQEVRNVEY